MLGFGGATAGTPPTGAAARGEDGSTPGGVETEAERRMRELQVGIWRRQGCIFECWTLKKQALENCSLSYATLYSIT